MRTPLWWLFNCLNLVKIGEAEIVALVLSFMWTPSFWSFCREGLIFSYFGKLKARFFLICYPRIRVVLLLSKSSVRWSVRFVIWLVVLEPQWLSGDVIARGPISLLFSISMKESCDKFSWISLFQLKLNDPSLWNVHKTPILHCPFRLNPFESVH